MNKQLRKERILRFEFLKSDPVLSLSSLPMWSDPFLRFTLIFQLRSLYSVSNFLFLKLLLLAFYTLRPKLRERGARVRWGKWGFDPAGSGC